MGTQQGMVMKHCNWHDAPKKGWEALTPCTRTIIRYPNWYIQVVVEFEQRDFRFGKFVFQTIFLWRNDANPNTVHLRRFLDGYGKTNPKLKPTGRMPAYQVNPVARMAEGGTETQQCSAWVAQREDLEDGLPGRAVQ